MHLVTELAAETVVHLNAIFYDEINWLIVTDVEQEKTSLSRS